MGISFAAILENFIGTVVPATGFLEHCACHFGRTVVQFFHYGGERGVATRSMEMYRQTASYRLIYVYGIDDAAHSGCLKVGETSVDWAGGAEELSENAGVLREAARRRIDQQTKTAGVAYELLHTEVAVRRGKDGQPEPFRDHDVHKMLTRNGVERMSFCVSCRSGCHCGQQASGSAGLHHHALLRETHNGSDGKGMDGGVYAQRLNNYFRCRVFADDISGTIPR